jgi:hypothetical protein
LEWLLLSPTTEKTMIQTRWHNRLIVALRVAVVVLCSGFAVVSSGAELPVEGNGWLDLAEKVIPNFPEPPSSLDGHVASLDKCSHIKRPIQHAEDAGVTADQRTHHTIPCSSACDTGPSCFSQCDLACSTAAVSPAADISDVFLAVNSAHLPLWPDARAVEGCVLPPLYRPPIV